MGAGAITEETQRYRVLFASTIDSHAERGTIVVAPHRDGWNDFGHQIRVDIMINPRDERNHSSESIRLTGFLGLLEKGRQHHDVRELSNQLAASAGEILASDEFSDFFTMLPDMAAYREIVSSLGSDEARLALSCLRDIVEAEEVNGNSTWLQSATDSLVFRRAFLRTSEAFFAWKNAGTALSGAKYEKVGKVSEELRIRFQLAGQPKEHELQVQFALHEPILPKRFAIVIGKNGVGKSQAIGRIADAAMRGLNTLTDGNGERPTFNRILAFYPTAVAPDSLPGENRRRSKVWYRRFSLSGPGFGSRRQTTSDLIVELARSTERIRDDGRFNIFLKAIRAIDGHSELALLTRHSDDQPANIEQLLRGGEQDLLDRFASIDPKKEVVRVTGGRSYGLSSGELSFVRFSALASLYIENSSLLLFDEPETHLHPNFISQFVMLLDGLLEQTGSAAIIATHSVYFVREAFEDQVRVLRSKADRTIDVEVPRLKTFGADVGTISYFVFGEDEPSRLAKDVERQIASSDDTWERIFETYKEHLSPDLLGAIRAELENRKKADPEA